MSEQLRQRLRDEMGNSHRPPVDGLVSAAIERGRRQRHARRVIAGAGTTAVVGVTVLAVGIGAAVAPNHVASRGDVSAGASGSAVNSAAPTTTAAPAVTATAAASQTPSATSAAPSSAVDLEKFKDTKIAAGEAWRALQQAESAVHPPHWTAAPDGVPATPQAELQLFTELAKPYGTTSQLGVSEDSDKTHVRTYLTTPDGKTGSLQWSMSHDTLGYEADCMPKPAAYVAKFGELGPSNVTCRHTDDGGYLIDNHVRGGCLEAADFSVVHPDGTRVDVSVASCLVDFSNTLHPGTQTLTEAQAEGIFQDPGFDFTMPADVVARGASLGNLPTFW